MLNTMRTKRINVVLVWTCRNNIQLLLLMCYDIASIWRYGNGGQNHSR